MASFTELEARRGPRLQVMPTQEQPHWHRRLYRRASMALSGRG